MLTPALSIAIISSTLNPACFPGAGELFNGADRWLDRFPVQASWLQLVWLVC
jgi:hypothetical protein